MPNEPLFSEPLQQLQRVFVRYRGRKLLYFAGCDYHRLTSDPAVLKEVARGLGEEGLNVAASRKTTGNHVLYHKLETAVARFFRVEDAVLTPNGYTTNLAVAQGFAGKLKKAFIDERAHPSLRDAAELLGCRVKEFKHRNAEDLRKQVKKAAGKLVVMTDGLFAHDGSAAPLNEYIGIVRRGSYLWVDDSHGAGVVGPNGRGTAEHFELDSAQLIQTTTFSKAFGVYGGAILGSGKMIGQIIRGSRLLTGSTPLPLPLVRGVLAALEQLREPGLLERLRILTTYLEAELGMSRSPSNPIFSFQGGAELRKKLLDAGIFPSYITYPRGSEEGFFRFAISGQHTLDQVQTLAECLKGAEPLED